MTCLPKSSVQNYQLKVVVDKQKDPRCFYFLTIPEDATISYTKKISWKRRSQKWWLWYWTKLCVEVVKKRQSSMRAWSCIRRLPPGSWHRRAVTGVPGERGKEFTRRHLPVSIGARPDQKRWLIGRRSGAKRPVYIYYISNAPVQERLAAFVRLSGVEEKSSHCLREAATGAGLNRYAVRITAICWLLTKLSTFFLKLSLAHATREAGDKKISGIALSI